MSDAIEQFTDRYMFDNEEIARRVAEHLNSVRDTHPGLKDVDIAEVTYDGLDVCVTYATREAKRHGHIVILTILLDPPESLDRYNFSRVLS
jgi:PleD family two-component response regulator